MVQETAPKRLVRETGSGPCRGGERRVRPAFGRDRSEAGGANRAASRRGRGPAAKVAMSTRHSSTASRRSCSIRRTSGLWTRCVGRTVPKKMHRCRAGSKKRERSSTRRRDRGRGTHRAITAGEGESAGGAVAAEGSQRAASRTREKGGTTAISTGGDGAGKQEHGEGRARRGSSAARVKRSPTIPTTPKRESSSARGGHGGGTSAGAAA